MNAVKQYVSAARLILETDHYDFITCKQINTTLPDLEQSLTCTVCRSLLIDPYSPTESTCQHHVCKACIGGKKRLRPSCSWCKDYDKYVRNTQLQCLLVCYKGLCEYVKNSSLLSQLTDFFSSHNDGDKNIVHVIQKGIELPCGKETKRASSTEFINDKSTSFHNGDSQDSLSLVSTANDSSYPEIASRVKLEPSLELSLSMDKHELSSASPCSIKSELMSPGLRDTSDGARRNEAADLSHSSYNQSPTDNASNKSLYSVSFTGSRNSKLILKRKPISAPRRSTKRDSGHAAQVSQQNVAQLPVTHSLRTHSYPQNFVPSSPNSNNSNRFRKSKLKPPVNSDRPNCRCGNATPKPGKLTCCGQRCACYMQSKACTGCRCRGCRNPHMFDGVKVLGRFKEDHQDSDLVIDNNSSSFGNLDSNFFNQQVSYIIPELSGSTVLNIS